MSDQRCGTCQYAKWQLTEKGNIRRSIAGQCLYVYVPAPLPDSYTATYHKGSIWVDHGKDCPTWQPK